MTTKRRYSRLITGLVIAAVLVSVGAFWFGRSSTNTATLYFTNTAGMYEGDPVDILGVPVGTVDAIVPEGERVRVEVSYDNTYKIPADAQAVIVAPTLVTGRYVQFTPPYTDGPILADGATIGVDRTAVPVEFDQVKQQLAQLSEDLGPNGANADGSVNRFLETTASALDGKGRTINDTIRSLSEATATLNRSGDDFFATVRGLQQFVSALSESDRDVVAFGNELSSVSQVLNNNRTELDAALNALVPAMEKVQRFVEENRGTFSNDLTELTEVTGLLVNRIDDIAALLHVAPTGVSDLYNIWDRDANSLTGALMVPDKLDPLTLMCALVTTVGAPQQECANVTDSLRGAALTEGSLANLMTPRTEGGTR
jgi:phospholipid/cholesterol/gamma-HCH transport system substrate-binding protein